ncbi:MAG: 2-amino-4-hydroxy-6-hydroxymethyldihydropteridine diphosphokinase [Pirellulales bacterium]|nr:2-amino-4-hydroxy-6-hydroxymethyldihydropteridine diphosphokinase [Pirellulales bacterium]
MPRALIGLGASLGDRAATLASALDGLRAYSTNTPLCSSRFFETAPLGGDGWQPSYLNAAAVIDTSLPAMDLLRQLQLIEHQHGRVRTAGKVWEPRTLDLDLLLFDQEILLTPTFTVPHRWLAFRDFALEPAVEIAADWRHPIFGLTLWELRNRLRDAAGWLLITGDDDEQLFYLAISLAFHDVDQSGKEVIVNLPFECEELIHTDLVEINAARSVVKDYQLKIKAGVPTRRITACLPNSSQLTKYDWFQLIVTPLGAHLIFPIMRAELPFPTARLCLYKDAEAMDAAYLQASCRSRDLPAELATWDEKSGDGCVIPTLWIAAEDQDQIIREAATLWEAICGSAVT